MLTIYMLIRSKCLQDILLQPPTFLHLDSSLIEIVFMHRVNLDRLNVNTVPDQIRFPDPFLKDVVPVVFKLFSYSIATGIFPKISETFLLSQFLKPIEGAINNKSLNLDVLLANCYLVTLKYGM